MGAIFETMLSAYKQSQFEQVNSPAYWAQVDQAVGSYTELIEQVQTRMWQKSAWWERRIAGRFLDLQTLAPQIDEKTPIRPRG